MRYLLVDVLPCVAEKCATQIQSGNVRRDKIIRMFSDAISKVVKRPNVD